MVSLASLAKKLAAQQRANKKAAMQAVQNQILQEVLLTKQGIGDAQLAKRLFEKCLAVKTATT